MDTQDKHTSGPWFTFEHADHSGMEVGPRYKTSLPGLQNLVNDVCTIRAQKHTYPCKMADHQVANANLIAAAPMQHDLIIALRSGLHRELDAWAEKYEVEIHGDYAECREQAYDACIAKATGGQK